MANKYTSKYNCNFDVANGYTAKNADKAVFKNALVTFDNGGKFNFDLLFEGQTVPNTMNFYWDFVNEKYNEDKFVIKQSKNFEVKRADGKAFVMEAVINVKDEQINQDYVAYFFRLDERFNYVGAFVFEKQSKELNDYRSIMQGVFASMESPLPKLEGNREFDPNVLI